MLLRRLTGHVQDQNWFAVGIDFLIVVAGILIAFQITECNDGRALDIQEKELLVELKREIQGDTIIAEDLSAHFANVHAAAKRSIAFMDDESSCEDVCWSVLADFFHASHWFPTSVKSSVFEEMRRQGLPRSREIVAAVESYHAQNQNNVIVLAELPDYRQVVRSLVPAEVHEAYWSNCWSLTAGFETIDYESCPPGVTNDVAGQVVTSIVEHPDTRPTLTFWFSEITPTADGLDEQNAAAERAIAAIDKELDGR